MFQTLPPRDETTNDVLWSLLPFEERVRLSECDRTSVRLTHPTKKDILVFRHCKSPLCPNCVHRAWKKERTLQARKILSLTSAASREGDDPELTELQRNSAERVWAQLDREELAFLRVGHIITTLPDDLAAIAVRDDAVLACAREATMEMIVRAYGHRDKKYRDTRHGRSAFALVMNLHPCGDERRPWPQPRAHLDVLLAGIRITTPKDGSPRVATWLPAKWPQRYDVTRATYRVALQRELRELQARRPTLEIYDALRNLPEKLDVRIQESRERGFFATGRRAMSMIAYSTRPHVWPAAFSMPEERAPDGRILVTYRAPWKGAKWHTDVGEDMFRRIFAIQPRLNPAENATWYGAFAGCAYTSLCEDLRTVPVYRKPGGSGYVPAQVLHEDRKTGWPEETPAPGMGAENVFKPNRRGAAGGSL